MQEKNQESGSGDMQRKLNWFDLICIGIGVLLVSPHHASFRFHANALQTRARADGDESTAGTGVILGSGVFTSTPYVAARLAG